MSLCLCLIHKYLKWQCALFSSQVLLWSVCLRWIKSYEPETKSVLFKCFFCTKRACCRIYWVLFCFFHPHSSPVGDASATAAVLPPVLNNRRRSPAEMSYPECVSLLLDFINSSWTWWTIVFVEVAQSPSVRVQGAFGAGNQTGLHSCVCCARHGCVCHLDTGVSPQRNDPFHHRRLKPEPGVTDTWCGAQLHPDLCPQSSFTKGKTVLY